MQELIQQFQDFLRRSPGSYHAVDSIRQSLEMAGFEPLQETDPWRLRPGGKYYVIRGGSSILSFRLPEVAPKRFRLMASHSDSPGFKLKPGAPLISEGLTRLNTEKYGGAIVSTWFDRPLSVAGRVLIREEGAIRVRLVYPDRDLAVIPSLAPHLSSGEKDISLQNHMLPLVACGEQKNFIDAALASCGIDPKKVLGMDLFLTCRAEPSLWGPDNAFLSAPRLDDLACAYGTMQGFLGAEAVEDALFLCVFDNEEVGSESKQGAASTFLRDVIDRVCASFGWDAEARAACLAGSFLVSADNAHAAHPGYPGASDPVNRPRMNGGIVLKHQAGQKYTTDGYSAAVIRELCARHEIPMQEYTNHSDQRGGSTLGNISNTQVSLNAADIGLAQLAMHSAYETMGAKDLLHLTRFSNAFYQDEIPSLV